MPPSKIPEEELITDLQRVAKLVDETPTTTQYSEHGEYSNDTLKRRFGSYNNAVEASGLEPNQQVTENDVVASDEELIADLRRVGELVDGTPTQKQYGTHGSHSYSTLIHRFGSWNDAIIAAGYEPNRHDNASEEDLISDLRQVATDLDDIPTAHQYDEHGKYSLGLLTGEFGSYNNALETAGFDVRHPRNIPAEELLTDLAEVADTLGETPYGYQYNKNGTYHADTLRARFGSYNAALEEIGHDPNRKQPVTDTELLLDIQRVTKEIEGPPTYFQYNTHGDYSATTLSDHFGSYNDAIRAAGYAPVRETDVPDDVLLTDIHDVADTLGKTPTSRQYNRCGEYHADTLSRRFGSYNSAVKAAGYEPTKHQEITDTVLLADIRDTADDQGRAPTSPEYTENGTYTARTIIQRFGTWEYAVKAAKCDPPSYHHHTDEELLRELQRLADGSRAPTKREMDIYGEYSPAVYQDRFGRWWRACVRAKLMPHTRVPLKRREYTAFINTAVQWPYPITSLVGLLAAFTGLTRPLLSKFSTEWIDRLHSKKRDTLIIVPSEHVETSDDWVLRVPEKWHPPSSDESQDLPLNGLLKWYQESQLTVLDSICVGGVSGRIRRIAKEAGIDRDRNPLDSNLRPSLAAHLIRQGAELWEAEMQVGFKQTNWGAGDVGIDDYLLWVYQVEGTVHHDYEPEGAFLDPPEKIR
jgi:hypothetical protein